MAGRGAVRVDHVQRSSRRERSAPPPASSWTTSARQRDARKRRERERASLSQRESGVRERVAGCTPFRSEAAEKSLSWPVKKPYSLRLSLSLLSSKVKGREEGMHGLFSRSGGQHTLPSSLSTSLDISTSPHLPNLGSPGGNPDLLSHYVLLPHEYGVLTGQLDSVLSLSSCGQKREKV